MTRKIVAIALILLAQLGTAQGAAPSVHFCVAVCEVNITADVKG